MDAGLHLTTLGRLQIHSGSQPIAKLLSRKVELLLIYVALQPQPQSREVLSTLLWPDQPQERGMTYLRTALANLQKQCAPYLYVTRQTIGMNPRSLYSVDIHMLQTTIETTLKHLPLNATSAADLEEALKLYQGPFLEGISLRDAPAIDAWISAQNIQLQQQIIASHQALGEYALSQNQPVQGIAAIQHALELDPLHELSHRLLMRLYLQLGNRGAAVAQYERCRQLLFDELQIEPSLETTALYHEIRSETITLQPTRPASNVPTPNTPFIPRPQDLQAIDSLMRNPACRFITLIGLGGIGKTRLAIEIATRYDEVYRDGVFYVSLPGLDTPDQMTVSILHALKLPLQGHLSPEKEIFQYLWRKQALLVLDNVETTHENALFLSRLSAHASQVKMLVTARERLNLQEEWVHPVHGLAVPSHENRNATHSEAVQLFLQSAQRSRPDAISPHDQAHIIRICQAVEGIPLAIELAAAWVRLLSVEKIAEEIERTIDFLAAPTRNIPERHRSMRAVFDSSWAMLNTQERAIFCRLSMFRSGFTQAAAQKVAQVDVFTLLALVDKSLLQVSEGRYAFHEMLRQYAYEKLSESSEALAQTLDRHVDYYADFFEQYGLSLMQDPEDPVYIALMTESQNCMLMWERLSQRGDVVTMGRLLRPFFRLFDTQNRYMEGERFFRQAIDTLERSDLPVDSLILARAKILLALCSEVVNRYTESEQLARESLPIFLAQDAKWDVQLAYRCLGRSAYAHGLYNDAQCYFEQARTLLEQMDEPSALATVLLRLSDIAGVLGQHEQAKRALEQSLRLLNKPAFKIARIRFLTTLGDIHIKLGELAEAEGHLLEAQSLCQLSDNRLGLTVVNSALGRVYAAQGRLGEAAQLFSQSIQQCDDLKHTWGKVFAQIHLGHVLILQGQTHQAFSVLERALETATTIRARWLMVMAGRYLSWAALAQGDETQALHHLRDALQETIALNAIPVTLEVLAGMAMLKAAQHDPDAISLAAFVIQHPLCEYGTRLSLEAILPRNSSAAPLNIDMNDLVRDLLDEATQG